jgi:hypothetical protein
MQLPVHSTAQLCAVLQSMVDPAPTSALHGPFSVLQSTLQLAPQLAPHDAAELQSTLQLSWHDPVHACVLLLQSMLHDGVAPQSTVHGVPAMQVQPDALHVPEVVVAEPSDAGGGAPTPAVWLHAMMMKTKAIRVMRAPVRGAATRARARGR